MSVFAVSDALCRHLDAASVIISTQEPPNALGLQQVHGNSVLYRDGQHHNEPQADAHWTDVPGLTLYVRTADCLPVLIEASGQAVAAVHAGWRGVDARIVCEVYAQWREHGIDMNNILWMVGPHICPDCFAMRQPEVDIFWDTPGRRKHVVRKEAVFCVDLLAIIQEDLAMEGWPLPRNITLADSCTFHQTTWPGYRRQTGTNQRIFSSICLRERLP